MMPMMMPYDDNSDEPTGNHETTQADVHPQALPMGANPTEYDIDAQSARSCVGGCVPYQSPYF